MRGMNIILIGNYHLFCELYLSNPGDLMKPDVKNFHDKLINFLHENQISYEISKGLDLSGSSTIIYSPKKDRHLKIELYPGGYNLHFSIANFGCFDEHDFSEDSSDIEKRLFSLIIQIFSEEILGFRAEYAGSIYELYCKPDEINKHIEKRMVSLKYSEEKGYLKTREYKFSFRSFNGTYDKDIQGKL